MFFQGYVMGVTPTYKYIYKKTNIYIYIYIYIYINGQWASLRARMLHVRTSWYDPPQASVLAMLCFNWTVGLPMASVLYPPVGPQLGPRGTHTQWVISALYLIHIIYSRTTGWHPSAGCQCLGPTPYWCGLGVAWASLGRRLGVSWVWAWDTYEKFDYVREIARKPGETYTHHTVYVPCAVWFGRRLGVAWAYLGHTHTHATHNPTHTTTPQHTPHRPAPHGILSMCLTLFSALIRIHLCNRCITRLFWVLMPQVAVYARPRMVFPRIVRAMNACQTSADIVIFTVYSRHRTNCSCWRAQTKHHNQTFFHMIHVYINDICKTVKIKTNNTHLMQQLEPSSLSSTQQPSKTLANTGARI